MANKLLYILVVLMSLASCQEKVEKEDENIQAEPMVTVNNLTSDHSRCVGAVCIESEWRTPQSLVERELKSNSDLDSDSLLAYYNQSLMFVITLSPYKVPKAFADVNILKVGIKDYNDYEERIEYINTTLKNDISLKLGSKTYLPKLFTFENNMDLTNYVKFIVVFTPDSEDSEFFANNILDLSFRDNLYNSGISHFIFDRNKL